MSLSRFESSSASVLEGALQVLEQRVHLLARGEAVLDGASMGGGRVIFDDFSPDVGGVGAIHRFGKFLFGEIHCALADAAGACGTLGSM